MELRRLNYFIQIAEDGSLTKAAGVLRIAQPALSRQMRLLEEELGLSLFRRTARGMQLTEDGVHLRTLLSGPLRELELVLQDARSWRSAAMSQVALGLPHNLAERISGPLALGLDRAFPNMSLKIVEGLTGSLSDWLGRGMVDFVLLEESARNDQLTERKLVELPLVLAGPGDGKFAPGVPVRFADAAQLPLILPSHHLGVRGAINDAALRARTKLNIRFEADAAHLIRDLLASGMGYTILPRCYLGEVMGREGLQVWRIVDPAPAITISLASRRNSQASSRRASAVEEELLALTRTLLEQAEAGA